MKTGEEHYQDYLAYLEKDDKQGLGLSLMASAFSGYAPVTLSESVLALSSKTTSAAA